MVPRGRLFHIRKNRLKHMQKMEFQSPDLWPAAEAPRGVPAGSEAGFWDQRGPEMSADIQVVHFRALVGEIRDGEQKITL